MREFSGLMLVLAVVCSLVCMPSSFGFEKFRKWTEESSGRSFEGAPRSIDRKKGTVEVSRRKGGAVTLEIEKLSEEDRSFLRDWIENADYLTTKIIGTKDGMKKVKVTVRTKSRKVTMTAYRHIYRATPYTMIVEPNTERSYEYWAGKDYYAELRINGKLIDTEGAMKKTGLGDR